MAARAVALGAVFVLVGATCSLTHDVDGISESGSGGRAATSSGDAVVATTDATVGPASVTSAATSGSSQGAGGDGGMHSGGGGAPPGIGGAGTTTTDTVTTTVDGATTTTVDAAPSAGPGCFDPVPCGSEGQSCCICDSANPCSDGSSCDGSSICSGCGALGEPPCNGSCDGLWMRPRVVGSAVLCLHCCVKCQGQGQGDVASGHKVNPAQGDESCQAAADKNCDNYKGCNTNDPGDCCDTSCVNNWGWSTCN